MSIMSEGSIISLRGTDKPLPFYYFYYFYLPSDTPGPFRIGVYSKSKEFAPLGSKFFLFRIDPFLEARQQQLDRITSPKRVHIPFSRYYIDIDIIVFVVNCS